MMKHLFSLLLMITIPLWGVAQTSLRPPRGLAYTAFQREVQLTWFPTTVQGVHWEIVVEGRTFTSTTTSCVINGLQPNTTYKAKVRTVKNGEASAFAELSVQTETPRYQASDPARIPYLRTIELSGRCPKRLPLYFNELVGSDATITYMLNGKSVMPDAENCLFIDTPLHEDKLVVNITESSGKRFIITYRLSVVK